MRESAAMPGSKPGQTGTRNLVAQPVLETASSPTSSYAGAGDGQPIYLYHPYRQSTGMSDCLDNDIRNSTSHAVLSSDSYAATSGRILDAERSMSTYDGAGPSRIYRSSIDLGLYERQGETRHRRRYQYGYGGMAAVEGQ
jgi:hypothetical protein